MADYTDNFNRADNSSLGSPWVESEAASWAIEIVTNRLTLYSVTDVPPKSGIAYWNQAFIADQYSQLTFLSRDGTASTAGRSGVGVRMSGTYGNASCYWAGVHRDLDGITLYKLVNGNLQSTPGTQLGTWSGTVGANDTIYIQVVGSDITVKRNGAVIIGPVTDSALTSGKAGVLTHIPSGTTSWASYFDNWAGGDVILPTSLEDLKSEINSQKEALEYLLVLGAAGIKVLEDLEAQARAAGEITEHLKSNIEAAELAFEVVKADIRASMDFDHVPTNVVAHALQFVNALVAAAGSFPAQEELKVFAGPTAFGDFSRLLTDIRAAATSLVFTTIDARAARAYLEEQLFASVSARPLPDFSGPFLRRFPFPKPGATNVPLNAPVMIRVRDEGIGVDIDTVWIEIDGVKFQKGDPEFTYEAIDGKKEYRVVVRPAADWLPNKIITVRAYGEDLAGNPGLKMERE